MYAHPQQAEQAPVPEHHQHQRKQVPEYFEVSQSQSTVFKRKRGRGRKSTSCIACNRRKQKCNSELPCLNCKSRGVGDTCAYKTSTSPPPASYQPSSIQPAPYSSSIPGPATSSSPRLPDPPSINRHRSQTYYHPYGPASGSSNPTPYEPTRPSPSFAHTQTSAFMQPQREHYPPRPSDFVPPTSFSHRPLPPPLHSPSFGHHPRPTLPPPTPSYEQRRKESSSSESEDTSLAPLGRIWNASREGPEESLTLPKLRLGTASNGAQDIPPRQRDLPSPRASLRSGHGLPESSTLQNQIQLPALKKEISPRPFRDEVGGASQLWDLLSLLPARRTTSDILVRAFLEQYNYHADVVFEPEFARKYEAFWSTSFAHDALSKIDMRWLALFFIVIAYGTLLSSTSDVDRIEREESSWKWYWACRKCILLAPSYSGASMDLVRAGLLVSRFLVHHRRSAEAWSTVGQTCRTAQGLGYHVDGTRWNLSPDQAELRRRLFSQLFSLDRSLSLLLRRPIAIFDQQYFTKAPHNLHDDELNKPLPASPRPLAEPTRSTYCILRGALAKIIGDIHERCFSFFTPSFEVAEELDNKLNTWAASLPVQYRLENPYTAWDESMPFLSSHRLSLHIEFFTTQIFLHRIFLLRPARTRSYIESRNICLAAARGDLSLHLSVNIAKPVEAYKLALGSLAFEACAVLGIIAIRDPTAVSRELLDDIEMHVRVLEGCSRFDLALENEVQVLKLCLSRARASRAEMVTVARERQLSKSNSPENGERFKSARPATDESMRSTGQRSPRSDVARDAGVTTNSKPALYAPGLTAVGPEAIFAAPWEYTNDGSFLVFPDAANLHEWKTLLDLVQSRKDDPL